jgi:hypothetical protein
MEPSAETTDLDWAKEWMCVTFTRGPDPAELFSRYGADPSRARLLDWDTASDLPSGVLDGDMVSLLRSGRLGDWTFCVEDEGCITLENDVLTALSRGTETYCVATTDGMDVFQYWRDGECLEYFEPGMEYSRSEPHGPWWDRVESVLADHEYGDDPGMAPVVSLVLTHLGLALDDSTLTAPWPSLTLSEADVPSAPRGHTYAGEGPVPPRSPTGN